MTPLAGAQLEVRKRRPCHDCGGPRTAGTGRMQGVRDGKRVPLCASCKAFPSRKQWEATLPLRFGFRPRPEAAALGFKDAVLGVML